MVYNNCALYMLLYKQQCLGFCCCSKRVVNARSVFWEHVASYTMKTDRAMGELLKRVATEAGGVENPNKESGFCLFNTQRGQCPGESAVHSNENVE